MKDIIDNIFKNVKYWKDKKLLLQAIDPECYYNKNIIIRLLGVTSQSISSENEAKKDMWNHQLNANSMGDDILKNVHPNILKDIEFARAAIAKYNRTYIFLDPSLKASQELAKLAAFKEDTNDNEVYTDPILKFMPEIFQKDHEIALMATTRNVDNLQYAVNLKRNKYFIIDLMNFIFDYDVKQKVLRYIDRSLLSDKRFVSKLGCFDNLCEQFHGDKQYVSQAVKYDLKILRKTNMFDQSILKSAMNNKDDNFTEEETLAEIFRYIEKFNDDYTELDYNIKDKKILQDLFWQFGETVSEEFV